MIETPHIPRNLASIHEVIEFYQKLIVQEEIKHKTLIGYSYGGGLVQLLMNFLPDQIDRAVLTHTGLLWGREIKSQKRMMVLIKIIPLFLLKKLLKEIRIMIR